jgi:hypothetical protein
VTGRPDGRPAERTDDEQQPSRSACRWPVVAGWEDGRPRYAYGHGRCVAVDLAAGTVTVPASPGLTPTQARRLADALLLAVDYLGGGGR